MKRRIANLIMGGLLLFVGWLTLFGLQELNQHLQATTGLGIGGWIWEGAKILIFLVGFVGFWLAVAYISGRELIDRLMRTKPQSSVLSPQHSALPHRCLVN